MKPAGTGVPAATGIMAMSPTLTEQPDPRLVGVDDEPRDARLYRRMLFIRRFEEMLLRLFDEGVLNGTTHCCIGQEANCVAVAEHLGPHDHVFSNHRCHGHYLAHTGDAFGLLAEIMGKESGICGGRGGSQHVCRDEFKSNGILGGTLPAAAGIAMAEQLRNTGNLSVVFMGDGALGEGIVYETLNLASLWRLPLFIVCEDNGWSQSTPKQVYLAGDVAARFQAFAVPVHEMDSRDVLEIAVAAETEIQAARETQGPRALLIHTYRLCHHSKNDDNRPEEEVKAQWEREPLVVHGSRLDEESTSRIEQDVSQALAGVLEQARNAP